MKIKGYVAALALLTPSIAAAIPGAIVSHAANVREKPSSKSHAFTYIHRGEPFDYTELPEHGWVKVEINGRPGYIARKLVKPAKAAAANAPHHEPVVKIEDESTKSLLCWQSKERVEAAYAAEAAKKPAAEKDSAPQVFEIVSTPSPEEELQKQNALLANQVNLLQTQVGALANVSADLKRAQDLLKAKTAEVAALRDEFPAIGLWDLVTHQGTAAILKGIGRIVMASSGEKVVIAVDSCAEGSADKILRSVMEEKFRTVSGSKTTYYYVFDGSVLKGAE